QPLAETPDPPAPDARPEPRPAEAEAMPMPKVEAPDLANDAATAVPDLEKSEGDGTEAPDDAPPLDLPAAPSPELPSVPRRGANAPTLAMPNGIDRARPKTDR